MGSNFKSDMTNHLSQMKKKFNAESKAVKMVPLKKNTDLVFEILLPIFQMKKKCCNRFFDQEKIYTQHSKLHNKIKIIRKNSIFKIRSLLS